MLLFIEGKIQTRSWEKDGTTHYITEIVADVVELFPKSQSQPQQAQVSEFQPILQPLDDEPF